MYQQEAKRIEPSRAESYSRTMLCIVIIILPSSSNAMIFVLFIPVRLEAVTVAGSKSQFKE